MAYQYIKALHIIFMVAWFAALFYMPRLFIYATEANEKTPEQKLVLQEQLHVMQNRLWYIIGWPAAILTTGFGLWLLFAYFTPLPIWLIIKLAFVFVLILYHFSLQTIYRQQSKGIYKYTSMQLRIWNEVATIILVAAVMLAVVKQSISVFWSIIGFFALMVALFSGIKIYKILRKQ